MGKWYEIYRDWLTNYEWFSECCTAQYTDRGDGTASVRNTQYYVMIFIQAAIDGFVSFSGSTGSVSFPSVGALRRDNYLVVSTDYTTYSIVYACEPNVLGIFRNEFLWVLGRERSLTDEKLDEIKGIVKE